MPTDIDCYVCGAGTLWRHRDNGLAYCRDCSRDSITVIPTVYSADDSGVRIVTFRELVSA